MDYERLKESFLQGEEREAAQMFREMMRGAVRAGLLEAMREEVEAICGPRYRPDPESRLRRAGSEKGIAYMDGGKEEIIRPRVREKGGKEVRLATYEAASSPQGLFDQIVAAVAQGLPVRGCESAMNKALSKSEISRMWVEKSREQLEALRARPLGSIEWMALVIDGVWLTRELCVVVAIGIESDGNKWVLDFEEGPSENSAVVLSLLERIKSRGFAPVSGRQLLILRDGSEAIESAVKRHWPESVRHRAEGFLKQCKNGREPLEMEMRIERSSDDTEGAGKAEATDHHGVTVREKETSSNAPQKWPSPMEVRVAFNAIRKAAGLPEKSMDSTASEAVHDDWVNGVLATESTRQHLTSPKPVSKNA